MNKTEKWNNRIMNIAHTISEWSEDESRGVGAVIVNPKTMVIVSTGYNGLPRGLKVNKTRLQKPNKYIYTEHAERNAIYNAVANGININNCEIFVTLFPCCDCARAIIQSGITKVKTFEPNLNDSKYGESFKASLEMFKECYIEVEYLNNTDTQYKPIYNNFISAEEKLTKEIDELIHDIDEGNSINLFYNSIIDKEGYNVYRVHNKGFDTCRYRNGSEDFQYSFDSSEEIPFNDKKIKLLKILRKEIEYYKNKKDW